MHSQTRGLVSGQNSRLQQTKLSVHDSNSKPKQLQIQLKSGRHVPWKHMKQGHLAPWKETQGPSLPRHQEKRGVPRLNGSQ